MELRRFFSLISFAWFSIGACFSVSISAEQTQLSPPNNIIMIVSDGMGPAYTTAYRYFKDTDYSDGVSPTIFDKYVVGSASTYPASESGLVTDSAAGATALATGVKSYNGAIAVDVSKRPLNTVMRQAKRQGMRTGLAVTSQIVHATPASYVTHNESRRNYNEIADQFFDDKIEKVHIVDVMLGGGTEYFERKDRNIVTEFLQAGYQFADSYAALLNYTEGQNLLGLFAPVGLPWALDDARKHRLSFLTEHAIKHLENEKGFFLLIEASQVDWAGHANDIASAMAEMDDLATTMALVERYVTQHPDTLVVLTADHSTGGLTIAAGGDYRWDPSWIRNMKSSVTAMAAQVLNQRDIGRFIAQQVGFELTQDEIAELNTMRNEQDQRAREQIIKNVIDARTNTGWTTSGHTGIDVPVFAFGRGAHLFSGGLDNTQIAHNIFALLKMKEKSRSSEDQ